MYLLDTNIISEIRKGRKANPGLRRFFDEIESAEEAVFLSVISVGELRRGIELIRHRSDLRQARMLETWLRQVLNEYSDMLLDVDSDVAQVWGRLRVPGHETALDKLIAATALVHDLTLVTRNHRDFAGSGVRLRNPFDER